MTLLNDGVNMTPNITTSRFEHVLNSAGIDHFRFHDLRHYSASIQHALGIPDAYIMQAGGWGDDRVLKDVYRHTFEESEKKMGNIAINYFDSMQHNIKRNTENSVFYKQGMRESNSHQRFWRPLSYHLTNPLYIK